MIENVPNQEPGQIRFVDFEGDTAWFNLYNTDDPERARVVITLPYIDDDGVDRYRAVVLTEEDRLALVEHIGRDLLAKAFAEGVNDGAALSFYDFEDGTIHLDPTWTNPYES